MTLHGLVRCPFLREQQHKFKDYEELIKIREFGPETMAT